MKRITTHLALVVALTILAGTAVAEGWKIYRAKEYGFTMLVPEDAKMKEKEWSGGWGGLYGEHEGVKLWGLAKLGAKESDEDIENYAVKLCGIPHDDWKVIDKGKDKNGWIRYHTVEAVKGNKLMFGGYGIGPKGSYLLYMETTVSDYNAHKADYKKWYDSIELD